MGLLSEEDPAVAAAGDESLLLLLPSADRPSPPRDAFHLTYIVYFILGAGFLLPWNAYITAVDYFDYLYPDAPVDRVFSVAYMLSCLFPLILIVVWWARRSLASTRINIGLVLFVLSLLFVPILDAAYVRGRTAFYSAYDATVGAVIVAGIADALVQGGVIGAAGELPERYMQAVSAGTAASGTLHLFFPFLDNTF